MVQFHRLIIIFSMFIAISFLCFFLVSQWNISFEGLLSVGLFTPAREFFFCAGAFGIVRYYQVRNIAPVQCSIIIVKSRMETDDSTILQNVVQKWNANSFLQQTLAGIFLVACSSKSKSCGVIASASSPTPVGGVAARLLTSYSLRTCSIANSFTPAGTLTPCRTS